MLAIRFRGTDMSSQLKLHCTLTNLLALTALLLALLFPLAGHAQLSGHNTKGGFGPEVTLPLASKSMLYGFLNLRYFRETGARTALEGNTFLATFTFPVPSIPLQ